MESWEEVTNVDWPVVAFDSTILFPDGTRIVASSTLRFRGRGELEADLAAAGFLVQDVRDAPDRPGRELVFLAQAQRLKVRSPSETFPHARERKRPYPQDT
jgi:hypothetical protein